MLIAWDERKRKQVIKDHGIDFATVTDVFEDPFGVYLEDFEHSTEDETRLNVIGSARCTDCYLLHLSSMRTTTFDSLRPARRRNGWFQNMRKEEKDYKYLETSPETLKRGFRRISRPTRLDLIAKERSDTKSRVTIYFDSDILSRFKEMSKEEGVGYQTLMNLALRRVVDGMAEKASANDLKNDILKDKKFLKRLKTALS